ncbi:YidC/Oxa1 family insertase periplasmic-domain containing protein [uncultured Gimesia sp.]|uniref:membrane protein insertase YidC n=1 Tax=uncultured Gimesia sp. TaxID=1678688 RepID=UPI00262FDCB6|nr:YidC/Oxa1 family insertase periplasmic-domain containing protein [uncultured Gimesia sp.]
MESKRLLLFVTLSATVLFAWQLFVMPILAPPQKPVDQKVAQDADPQDLRLEDAPLVARKPGETKKPEKVKPDQPVAKQAALLKNPRQNVVLGSLDPETGYFLQVSITTEGASLVDAFLNDPLYRELTGKKLPLKVLDKSRAGKKIKRSLELDVDKLNAKLASLGTNCREADWKILKQVKDPDDPNIIQSVRLGLMAPDGTIEVQKEFGLKKYLVPESKNFREFRDTHQAGYLVHFKIQLINHSDAVQKLDYRLLGPVGIPLENADNTRKFRDVRIGFLEDDSLGIRTETLYAPDIIEQVEEGKVEKFSAAFQFAGIDIQYFAALLTPDGKNYKPELINGQMTSNYSSSIEPVLINRALNKEAQSRVTVQINSNEIDLASGAEETHSYAMYTGPKRESLLGPPLKATEIMDLGIFGPVAKLMLWLLNTLHGVGLSYGFAIIGLTIMVRGSLYPLSRKQAVGAQKMKELQPQIVELKKKYADDREKLGKAQMELFSKNNYNPLAGCLPIFLQLPIFFGLYTALNNAVQLRGTPFLWIDNLAAPDALFQFPFNVPFLGNYFNLLPLVTVGLFVIQQKLFMPPPTDKDQELQHKIMNYMMIFMGFMFYHVPAGLCVYFIASSLWGICERKLLDFQSKRKPAASETQDSNTIEIKAESKKDRKKEDSNNDQPQKKGWFARLQEIADQAQEQAALKEKGQQQNSRNKGTGKKSKKRR